MYVNIVLIYNPNLLFSDVKYVDAQCLINCPPWMNMLMFKTLPIVNEILNCNNDDSLF